MLRTSFSLKRISKCPFTLFISCRLPDKAPKNLLF